MTTATDLVTRLTVLNKQNRSTNYSIVTLEKPANFAYDAGQCINVGLLDMPENEARVFSITSSPTEEVITLLVKHGFSEYKKRLLNLAPGDELVVSKPMGGFELGYRSPVVMVAGGMGIAPFRSIIKYLVDVKHKQKLMLIHLYPTKQSPFVRELNELQRRHKLLQFSALTDTKKRLHLHDFLLQEQVKVGPVNPIYYLSGPTEMIAHCQQTLEELGVDPKLIRIESNILTALSRR